MVSRGSDRVVLWPRYFDAHLSRKDGRRVGEAIAVKGPDARWIEAAARKLGLDPVIEEAARHPSVPYERSGRVLVAKSGPKQSVVEQVGRRMRESQDGREAA